MYGAISWYTVGLFSLKNEVTPAIPDPIVPAVAIPIKLPFESNTGEPESPLPPRQFKLIPGRKSV
jgi:hypothetical protein